MTDCLICIAKPLRALYHLCGWSVWYLDYDIQKRVIPDHGEVSDNEIGVRRWRSCCRWGSHHNSRYSQYSVMGRGLDPQDLTRRGLAK